MKSAASLRLRPCALHPGLSFGSSNEGKVAFAQSLGGCGEEMIAMPNTIYQVALSADAHHSVIFICDHAPGVDSALASARVAERAE